MIDVKIDNAELTAAVRRIRGLDEFTTPRQRKAMLRKGAKIIRDAARVNVPIAPAPYKNRKGETITPGFTVEAIEVKSLRKSNDLFVGVSKKDSKLAYWAAWLEFGATNVDGSRREGHGFMRQAVATKGQEAAQQIIKDAQRLFDRIVKKVSIN